MIRRWQMSLSTAAAATARERADQAEETAVEAEERAELAQEAADLAQEWADAEERRVAQERADMMQQTADRRENAQTGRRRPPWSRRSEPTRRRTSAARSGTWTRSLPARATIRGRACCRPPPPPAASASAAASAAGGPFPVACLACSSASPGWPRISWSAFVAGVGRAPTARTSPGSTIPTGTHSHSPSTLIVRELIADRRREAAAKRCALRVIVLDASALLALLHREAG